ncbi:MAG TPA: hypothetical protein VGH27_17920 [Streptosporangiaceae bacterium]|jgi:hypothetical protein
MITPGALRAPFTRDLAGMGVLDIAIALLLSAYAVVLVDHHNGSAGACAGVLAMTLPVAWRRRAPMAAAIVLAVAALLNGLVFGHLVRCGPALPAIFLVAFTIGTRRGWAKAAAGLLVCAAATVAEGLYDPRIGGPALGFVLPIMVGFFAAGGLVRARMETAQELRSRSAELRHQREQTAQLAVLADRARVSADLEAGLHDELGGIAAAAAGGLDVLDTDQDAARQALTAIEHDGRAVLGRLREVLGALHEPAPSAPQPTLARLSELLARATSADARLTVEGSARTLPAGLELSGYRIVEHLLLALDDAPDAAVRVRLRFSPEALELHVSGPRSPTADLRAVLAAARERAGLHGGTVDSRLAGGICYATARIPLVSGYA